MDKDLSILSHAPPAGTLGAIALLVSECEQLKAQGIERGSVQPHGKHGYRLAWWANGKVRTRGIERSEVEAYKAAHVRWREWKRLQQQIKFLERKL